MSRGRLVLSDRLPTLKWCNFLPVQVVSQASGKTQRSIGATLRYLPRTLAAAALETPATILAGHVLSRVATAEVGVSRSEVATNLGQAAGPV